MASSRSSVWHHTNNNPSSGRNSKQDKGDQSPSDSEFECNICLEVAKNAVVSMCGHLFCWSCLYRWLDEIDSETLSAKNCPVCRSAITLDRIIPIYGRGGGENNQQDPRSRLQPRPPGVRTTEVPYLQEQIYQINILPIEHPRTEIFGYGFHLTIGFGSLFGYMLLLFYLTKKIEKI